MIEIRRLTNHEELAQAVELQKVIWGFADIEVLPARTLVVARKVGGQVFAAFDGHRMVGFCVSVPGLKPGGNVFLHSHMMGVLPEYNNQGIGRRLKLWQRDEALARSIRCVEWTFDPLGIKNAYFNIEKLGAIVRRHVFNEYGITASPLHGGLPTNRCVAEWWLDSGRVRALLSGSPEPRPLIEASVAVPAEIDRLRRESPPEVRKIQASIGEQFTRHFSRGLAVVGFDRTATFGTYLLGQWKEDA